ncbi:FlaA1/EpsC-like NDP-sugar epimerase [Desulfitispora alkaliphila]|uniref:polysaccharide biosynthesis protein n=1 Tax=Desulfitispora alkaliphila TaxID=622674 RepID=UPI003D1A0C15
MDKFKRIGALMAIDTALINIAFFTALLIRFESYEKIPGQFMESFYSLAPIFTVIFIACFYFFGLYNRVWRYASIGELVAVISAVTVALTASISASYFLMAGGGLPLPRGVFALMWLLNIVVIGGSRLGWRLVREHAIKYDLPTGGKPVLIVGAGSSGVIVAKELMRHYKSAVNIVGFVDDDSTKQSLKILGIPILGDRSVIKNLVEKYGIQEIILAIPSAEGKVVRELVAICHETDAEIKILPGMYDLIEGNVTVNQIREVQVEDLLGREQVKVDMEGISKYLEGQVVLVTGGGGSIGSELCRQIASFSPKRLLILDNCENNLYDIELELKQNNPHLNLYPLVKDIRDKKAIEEIFKLHKPQVIFHAAAHKHVPLMENNPEEAIKNNVMGTYNVAQAADKYKAKKFVLISTDKAVNPTSVMGASKRVAEMFIQHLDITSETNFAAVRFGNVLASRGSVIPIFKRQIAEGGPVTVTHEEMVRYFMTIPEAVQLVIQTGAMAKGGEIFVLDMGEPVKIMDLAKSLIKLSGFEPGEDIEIVITGMRPGEKLYEELLTAEEGVNATTHKRIFVAKPNGLNKELIEEVNYNISLGNLPGNQYETEMLLQQFIPEFRIIENKLTS